MLVRIVPSANPTLEMCYVFEPVYRRALRASESIQAVFQSSLNASCFAEELQKALLLNVSACVIVGSTFSPNPPLLNQCIDLFPDLKVVLQNLFQHIAVTISSSTHLF
mmetsp:Transcript_80564/g.163893  ORF Transcript_80564/g.163893 Transcript_80564/m.163893 type:complete len:108 (-) Transcript_80564:1412-1735(-)